MIYKNNIYYINKMRRSRSAEILQLSEEETKEMDQGIPEGKAKIYRFIYASKEFYNIKLKCWKIELMLINAKDGEIDMELKKQND
jgi:hypothetical protein